MTPLLILQQAIRQRRKATAGQAQAIERIANRLSPQLRKRFLEAVKASKDSVDLEALAMAIQSGSATQAEIATKLGTWPEKYVELSIDLKAGFIAGAGNVYEVLDGHKFQLNFTLINPHAVDYAARKLPQIVRSYVADAKETIQTIIVDSVSGKYTGQEAAKLIRDSIGLTPRYERAVDRMRERLSAEGVTGDKLNGKVERYAAKLLRSRANTIARTEIIQAQVSGQRALWQEAANEGIFDRKTAKRVWKTNHEGVTDKGNPTPCELCAPMDGQEIDFGGLYEHPEFGSSNIFGDLLSGPPLHPNCLCSEDLQT